MWHYMWLSHLSHVTHVTVTVTTSYDILEGWCYILYKVIVVVTTRLMSNSSTTSKSLRWISSGEHELCNLQENSTGNHNSILPTIYIDYPWSILQLRICYAFYPNVYALSLCLLLIYLASTSRPACHIHVPWHHTLNPTLHLCHPCVHYVYTMRNLCY